MADLTELASIRWQPVRPDLARGVLGKVLLDGPVKVVLTRVISGGSFPEHCDPYGHLFYIMAGSGSISIEGREKPVAAGTVVRIDAGERHGYENRGDDELLLLSLNLPL